jgi:Tol biopolymer transport system component
MGFIRAMRLGLVAACLAFLAVPGIGLASETYTRIVLGGFSPDGKQLALSYCLSETTCKTGIFDLARKRFVPIVAADRDSFYIPGGFSPNGKQLAVTVRHDSDKGAVTQLGLLELATGKLTELTHAPGRRAGPSFSHDGKKIIYAQANRERPLGKTRFVDWDIYEFVLKEGNETRLTEFRFFSVTPPSYVGTDEEFIFSGGGSRAYVSPTGVQGAEAYAAIYQDNDIFRLKKNGPRTLQPFFQLDNYSNSPVVSTDGSVIVFTGMSNKLDGIRTRYTFDLFLFDAKGHKRLTKVGDPFVMSVAMTPNGRTLAFVLESRDQRRANELKLLDVASGQVETLNPDAALVK